MRCLGAVVVMLLSYFSWGQDKKIIDHTVYNDWKSLSSAQVSNDGRYIAYEINPHRGDGVLCIYDTNSGSTDTIKRATRASFSGGGSYIAFKVTPGYDTLRTCELNNVKKEKWPKDSLGIYLLGQDSLAKYPELKSFSVNEENDWMAVTFDHNTGKTTEKKKKRGWFKRRKKEEVAPSNGKLLWLYHPDKEKEFVNTSSAVLSEKGNYVVFTTHRKVEAIDSVRWNVFSLTEEKLLQSTEQYTVIEHITINHNEDQFAFLATKDTSEVKQYSLFIQNTSSETMFTVDPMTLHLDSTEAISKHYRPSFTLNDAIMYFGVGEREREEPKDTLTKKEKVKLDLWHYKDQRLQPQQLLEKDDDLKESLLYAYHFKTGDAVRLENDTLSVYPVSNLKGAFLLGMSDEPYVHTYNWVSPRPHDYYRVNVETGEAEPLLKAQKFYPSLAPSGQYLTYFKDGEHHFMHIESGDETCMTCDTEDVVWTEDMNGMPMEAYPKGGVEWTRDERHVLIQSEFDYWMFDHVSGDFSSYTHEMGAINNVGLELKTWERDSVYMEPANVYFTGFDNTTKGTHYYDLKVHEDHVDLVEVAYFDARLMQLQRSKNKQRKIIRKMTFQQYPDLYTYTENMQEMEKVSETNPQQEEYNWGTVELTKWTSYDGIELEGLLYKPEDFDSTKSYPLMVYFYELYADRLHNHYIPKPTASIIYATEYASAGYVVFMPDIRYKPGHPAASAYDCIMSGTDHVLELLPNVDSTRMALQGQSWGGYQTAQLVTMTPRYRAAMAGAPVANMFSAYGGIRWGSGLNRQFQYERTQSRIGYTIWERPDLYIENSPLFHLPNVETPLMIMHNDADGAVPWYQGIELFTGLKRLGKPTWLLNYNDDDHNLMRNANRMDLSIRMRQFFDHYLKDAPAPQWLTEGIPAKVKGKELRYE
jgi:dipeptidyl aminopeptidase/acylaminoacyl peptidase